MIFAPIIIFIGLFGILRIKKMSGKMKTGFTVFSFLLVLLLSLFPFVAGAPSEFKVIGADEAKKQFSNNFFEEFGDYESVEVYKYSTFTIFRNNADTIILNYTENEFYSEINRIDREYSFYDEAQKNDAIPVFEYSGFSFRLCESQLVYPNSMNFIGVNYETKEIAYVTFLNKDLDSVSSFEYLIKYDCGWKYIEAYRRGGKAMVILSAVTNQGSNQSRDNQGTTIKSNYK